MKNLLRSPLYWLLSVLLLIATACVAQPGSARSTYSGEIAAPDGRPVAGANVRLQIDGHTLQAISADDGGFLFSTRLHGPAAVQVRAAGFAPLRHGISRSQPVRLTLSLAAAWQRVVVTASKTPMALDQSANAVQVLSRRDLQHSASLTLADRLTQVTGFQLYRRSSTLVANPTAQGISLRGLGSTSASRTLVLADGVPLSDPFGGWVDWNQVPALAIQDVEVVSGGVSNLYGSGAIGGVVNIIERQPNAAAYAVDAGYAQENTPHISLLGAEVRGPWSGMAAADLLRTDGYIVVAPDARGPIDTRANVHYENGEIYLRRIFAPHALTFLRGNVLNEARGNGTPLQKNSTRFWRYSTGVDWTPARAGAFALRLFGSDENYFQTFSSVAASRASEALTRLQQVPTQQLGGSTQWTRALFSRWTLVAGADVDDVRATDFETPIQHGNPNGVSDTSARQRDTGVYAEAILQLPKWTVTGSLRGDNFRNLDAIQFMQTGSGPILVNRIPNRSEAIFSPKLGVVRRVDRFVTATGSAYRAFRSPTLNELYRGFQVGQEITLPNADLQSERATGWETGAEFTIPVWRTSARASYFWTEVNRPVTSLLVSATPTKIIQRRENLGQIRSRGVALAYRTEPLSWISVTGGYQYANATVTKFSQDPQLVGTWIPEVPHNTATMQARATKPRLGAAALLATVSGKEYDSDGNTYLLHGYFRLDAYVSHALGSRVDIYGSVNNLFNRSIETGRTPILTLGTPRMVGFGIRIHSPN